MNHAGVKSSIDSSRMFNEPYAEIPSGALGTWGCPGSPGGRVHLSPSPSICLTDSFIWPRLSPSLDACHGSGVEGFICLPLSPFICLPLSPSLDAWHGSLGGRVHLSPFVSLHLSPVASQPGCLARLSGWTGSFVSLCLPSFVWHGSLGFVSLHLSPVVSQPGCLARLSRRTDSLVSLCLFICLPLSPSLDAWYGSFGWTVSLVSLCLPSFGSPCLPAWMSVTALQADGFTCLPWFPFICFSSLWVDGLICLPLSPFVSRCLPAWMPLWWTDSFVSLCLPLFVSRCLPAWMPLWVDGFICLPLSPSLDRVHVSPFVPFICLPFSPSLDAWHGPLPPSLDVWHGSLGGRVHLSPFVSLHLSPVSHPGCLARLSAWTGSFVYLCLPGCLAPLCFPSFVSRCLPAWMPGTVFLVDRFTFLPLSPFIWLLLSPSLDVCHGSPGGRIHLSPLVPLHLSPISVGGRIHLSPVVSQPGSGSCVSLCPLHLSPVLSQPGCLARPVASQPGCLARLSGWTGSFVSLCLPSFVSRLPPWMPGAALCVDGFICLPLSPRMSGTPLFPFICFPLSPSLDAWHCFFGGQIHFSPFVSLHLAPVVSQPGCLSRLSRRTDSLVSLGSPSFVSHLCGWTDSFVSLCLPLFVSRCLPAWMPGTALWVDGFICLPLSPSLNVWHSRSAVSFTSRGSVLLAGSGLPSALALASVIPCLVDVGDRVLLCLPFIWTSISLGLGRLPCLSLATPCLFVQCLVISCGPELTIAVRCGARLQLREGSVNPPLKQT